jgi:hypothetical protein
MTLVNGYCTLPEIKDIRNINDNSFDAALERQINAVSRFIDEICWRRFYSVNETRYFTPNASRILDVFDITSIDTLKTDNDADRTYATTWAVTDYDLMPANALLDDEPYTEIHVAPNGNYSFPKIAKGVEIKGDFGYIPSGGQTPPAIIEACLLGVSRISARENTPLGAAAQVALGKLNVLIRELRTDPDFMNLVLPLARRA